MAVKKTLYEIVNNCDHYIKCFFFLDIYDVLPEHWMLGVFQTVPLQWMVLFFVVPVYPGRHW